MPSHYCGPTAPSISARFRRLRGRQSIRLAHDHSFSCMEMKNPEMLKSLRRLNSPNPRDVFIICYLDKVQINECSSLHNNTCAAGCKLPNYLEKIAWYTFNLKAKNFVSECNDEIAKRKRERSLAASHKRAATAKKVKKLSSK